MRYIILLTVIAITTTASAQSLLPTPKNIQAAYNKGTRSTDGKAGKNYWQNKADYIINASFYPVNRFLSGIVSITYSNNSPDTLKQIVFKLYPNLYKRTSPRNGAIAAEDLSDGVSIDKMEANGKSVNTASLQINGTNMWVNVPPVLPGQRIEFKITYHYTLNKGSHNRTGEVEPGAAFVAYFFPRIAVYDDVDGWNMYAYNGMQEFYNDFCNFDVMISVPENFGVWATGEQLNAQNIFKKEYYDRLMQAEKSDAIITIIDSSDIAKKDLTVGQGMLNWHFNAKNVTDFVFAVSDHYMWQSSSLVVDKTTGRRTRVDAVFNPKHKDYLLVAGDARKTVEAMSYVFPAWPYPYSHETVFDGLDQMEYPMMVNDNPVEDRAESIELTDHEIFHTMFPFYMGINETKYAWMDEGWATIGEWIISPIIDSSLVDEYGVGPTSSNAGNETDMPIMTLSTELSRGYFTNSYPKPAMGYLFIKDYLGDALFTKALHHYIEQWNGKHPLPNDFFYSMNEGAGKNLNWFWQKWFFENGIPDLAISSVKKSGKNYSVVITSKGSKPVPVDLTVFYDDGTTEKIHRSIGVWEKGNITTTISFSSPKKATKILQGAPHTPDSNLKDNTYSF